MSVVLFNPYTGKPRLPEHIRADPHFREPDGPIRDPVPLALPRFVPIDGIWFCCTSAAGGATKTGIGRSWRDAWIDFEGSDWLIPYAASV